MFMKTHQGIRSKFRLFFAFSLFLSLIIIGLFLSLKSNSPSQAAKAGSDDTDHDRFAYSSLGSGESESLENSSADAQKTDDALTLELDYSETQNEAEQRVKFYKSKGIVAFYTPVSRNGRVIFRIRTGLFSSESEARNAQIAIREQNDVKGKIVRLQ